MAKLNHLHRGPFACSTKHWRNRMDDELKQLTERWIVTFCEMPVLLDAELMRRLLAESEGRTTSAIHD